MTQQLRDELAHIADTSPGLDLPDDLWRRGRRARTHGRLVAAGAALAAIVGVGGLVASVVGGPLSLPPAGSPDVAAVPTRIEGVPDWLVQFPESDTSEMAWAPELDGTTDLAVGQAAAAFAVGSGGRLPVVVSAADGSYHPLDLPGFSDAAALNNGLGESSALALSPDGTRLAYAWWNPPAPLDAAMPAGVRIIDLDSGDIDTISLTGSDGVDVDQLGWSPSGDWLAWFGVETESWSPTDHRWTEFVAGRIRAGSLTSHDVPTPRGIVRSIAVSDVGSVAFLANSAVIVEGSRTRLQGVADTYWSAGSFAPASDLLALSEQSLGTLPLVRTSSQDTHFVPVPGDAAGVQVGTLGWTGGGDVVAARPEADDEPAVLALVELDDGTWRDVGEIEAGLLPTLTVATDLLGGPTVDRPSPRWPWSTGRRAIVAGLAALALLLLAAAVRRHRRAR